jgi:hypothetical protein
MCCVSLFLVVNVSNTKHSLKDGQLGDHLSEDLIPIKLIQVVERKREEFLPDNALIDHVLNFIKEFELVPLEGRRCEPLNPNVLFDSLAYSIVHHFV